MKAQKLENKTLACLLAVERAPAHSSESLLRRSQKLEHELQAALRLAADLQDYARILRERWHLLSPNRLQHSMGVISKSAQRLSRRILGNEVKVCFDASEDGPLGYVKAGPKRYHREPDTVYLSLNPLIQMPRDTEAIYRAILIHEMGHILIHNRSETKLQRKVLRKLNRRVKVDPHFSWLFNILLDEHLERVLRDRFRPWSSDFQKLRFYWNRRNLKGFKAQLGASWLTHLEDRYWKVSEEEGQSYVRILSAAILRPGYGFHPIEAFTVCFRSTIPRRTIDQPWLAEALEAVPKKLPELTLLGVFQLAAEIYRILMKGMPGLGNEEQQVLTYVDERGELSELKVPVKNVRAPIHLQLEEDGDVPVTLQRRPSWRPSYPSPRPEELPPPPVEPDMVTGKLSSVLGKGTSFRLAGETEESPLELEVSVDLSEVIIPRSPSRRPRKKKTKKNRRATKARMSHLQDSPQPEQRRNEKRPYRKKPNRHRLPKTSRRSRRFRERKLDNPLTALNQGFQKAYLAAEQDLNRKLIPLNQLEQSSVAPAWARRDSDETYPAAVCSHRLVRHKLYDAELEREVRPHVAGLLRWMEVFHPELRQEEELLRGSNLSGNRLLKYLSYGEVRLFRARRLALSEARPPLQLRILLDTSASMHNEGRLDQACRLACLLCLLVKEWPSIEGRVYAFNDSLVDCGDISSPALSGLAPSNGTNDAGALEYVLKTLESHRKAAVFVLSDAGSTLCAQMASRALLESLRGRPPRILFGSLGPERHPAFDHWVDLQGPLTGSLLKAYAKALSGLFGG